MTKVVLNMQHKYTNGIKHEFVEDTFLDIFYKVHNLDYITDEFLQLELEEYFFKKTINENIDIYEYIENLSDDQLERLIVGAFSDDYYVSLKLKELYVSSLYVKDGEDDEYFNDYENRDNWYYFENDEQAIDYYLYQDDWDLKHTNSSFEYTISRVEGDDLITIYELKK